MKYGLGIRHVLLEKEMNFKRIVIFVPTLYAGGAEKQAALLAKTLSGFYRIDYVVCYKKNSSAAILSILESCENLNLYFLGEEGMNIKSIFYSLMCKLKPDVLFNYLTFCDVWGCIEGRRAGIRYIFNGIRNNRLPFSKLLLEWGVHNFYAYRTIFNCYSGKSYFAKWGFSEKKSIVIPNCFLDIEPYCQHKNNERPTIITVGRFVAQKDFDTCVKTVACLKEKIQSNFRFQIVGYGELENRIRSLVEKYEVNDVVEFIIKPDNIPELLRNADIYLSTSLFEGTSNSIMEALNADLPIVATNVGDNDCLIVNSENGFLHRKKDFIGLSESLHYLIEKPDLRNAFGFYGKQLLVKRYSFELFQKRYIELLESLK